MIKFLANYKEHESVADSERYEREMAHKVLAQWYPICKIVRKIKNHFPRRLCFLRYRCFLMCVMNDSNEARQTFPFTRSVFSKDLGELCLS